MPNRLPKEQSVNVRVLFADDDLLQRQSKAEIHKETEYGKTDGALRYMVLLATWCFTLHIALRHRLHGALRYARKFHRQEVSSPESLHQLTAT